MAYHLEDQDGYVGPGPCINGLRQLKVFLKTTAVREKNLPAMTMLIEHGRTHLNMQLAVEARSLAPLAPTKDVRTTLTSLAQSAAKAKGAITLVDS